jgi:hypothetical protein
VSGKGIGGHTRTREGATNNWGTPLEIVDALGVFDLDPCGREGHSTAFNVWTEEVHDGLNYEWLGRVWMNPPYGPHTGKWLDRLAEHGDGIALVFARTETQMYWEKVWQLASGILFLKGRLHFIEADGTRAKGNSGGPSTLIAYGARNVEALANSGLPGALVRTWEAIKPASEVVLERI